jgi:hypothetical protein
VSTCNIRCDKELFLPVVDCKSTKSKSGYFVPNVLISSRKKINNLKKKLIN